MYVFRKLIKYMATIRTPSISVFYDSYFLMALYIILFFIYLLTDLEFWMTNSALTEL